ncbi:MAG: Aromatic compounds degradation protein paaI [Frankiales bacterium]|nr:Aromatic compounds degradation protein paaI [Frankiales bacterium]
MDLDALLSSMPFAVALGMELTAASPEQVRGRLAWAPERCTLGGTLHGGALMALADSVGAVCAFLGLPDGAGTATLSSSTSLLRGVRDGYVEAVARPLHRGRTTVVVVTEMRDAAGRLVATTTQTQAVLV